MISSNGPMSQMAKAGLKVPQSDWNGFLSVTLILLWFIWNCDLVEITVHGFRNYIVFVDYRHCTYVMKSNHYCPQSCKKKKSHSFMGRFEANVFKSISWRGLWNFLSATSMKNSKIPSLCAAGWLGKVVSAMLCQLSKNSLSTCMHLPPCTLRCDGWDERSERSMECLTWKEFYLVPLPCSIVKA